MKTNYINGREYKEDKEIVEIVEKDIESETMYARNKFEYILLNIQAYEKYDEEDINSTEYRAKYLINKKTMGKNNKEYIMISIERYYNGEIECYMQKVEMSNEDIEKWY